MQATIATDIWAKLNASIAGNVNQQTFEAWMKPLKFGGYNEINRTLRLIAPNQISKDWVNTNFGELIRRCARENNVYVEAIEWTVEEAAVEERASSVFGDAMTVESKSPYTESDFVGAANHSNNLINLLGFGDAQTPSKPPELIDLEPLENPLNPKCKFGTFVVGSCNQFAHAAALAVAEAPGKTYNPLYIYGGVGLGKTHLVHAVGHTIKERNKYLRLLYISAEKFMNELINAIRYDKTQGFREKYRSIDVLLMDDIQFMAGKERTQEEFFHTFNALYDGQKQIVITSDCPPREIPTLEERLHSRFEWGLIADMEPPDLETKIAILKRKADLDGVQLPDDVALYIANKVKSNIRELEGSLVRLIAIASLRGVGITKMLAQDAVRNIMDSERPSGVTIEQIQRAVARAYKINLEDLLSKNNSRQIAVPRQVAMYLCKRLTKRSFPEIGREFSGKHHTTVIHSVEKIEALVAKDENFHRVVTDITDSIIN